MRMPFKKPNQASLRSVNKLQQNNYNLIVSHPTQFTGYPVIFALMSVLQVLTVIFGNKRFLLLGKFSVSLGWIWLMPIVFFLFQIVSECYGWQYVRQIIWSNCIVNATLAIVMLLFKQVPPHPELNMADIENAYKVLLQYQTVPAFSMLISMFIADYISSALMCWSKFHWKGRYLITRIVILHCLAELIIGSGWLILGPMYGYKFSVCLSDILDSFYARSIIMVCMLPLASLVIWWIQNRLERVVVFDLNVRFAPFKFKINPSESVQFITEEWRIMPKEAKKDLDIPKYAMQHFSTHASVKIKIF